MKRIIYIFAFAGLIATSCSKEAPIIIEDQASQPGTYTYVINGSMTDPGDAWAEEDPETKTTYAGDKTFAWSNGDQISVLFHKGDDNKFFTFTIVKGGLATGKFVGEVTEGYTIGSSDDGTKWALYPANANHAYDKDASNKISFFIPASTDVSDNPTILNLPMEARGDASDNFTFKQTMCAYKYVFTGLSSVSKVKLTVENTGNGYYMSGNSPLVLDGSGDYYLEMYSSPLGGSKIVSITTSVVSNTATIYVPSRGYNGLKATITLQNMDAGANYENIIYKASSTGTGLYSTVWGRICKLPSLDVSAYGVGAPFWSKFGVNWNSVTASASGDGPFRTIKAKQDGNYLYLYLDLKKSDLNFSGDYTHYHRMGFYFSDGTGTTGVWNQDYSWSSGMDFTWLIQSQAVAMSIFNDLDDIIVDKNVVVNDSKDTVYIEFKIDRAATLDPAGDYYAKLNPALSYLSGTSVYVGVVLDDVKVPSWSGSVIGYAPVAGGDMLAVTMTALP